MRPRIRERTRPRPFKPKVDDYVRGPRPLWVKLVAGLSAVVSLAAVGAIAAIWVEDINAPYEARADETVVESVDGVSGFLSENSDTAVADDASFIPTGIVVQSMEFKGPYTVQVAGYVWQRYADDLVDVDRGIIFPEADSTTLVKVYETQQDGETLVGWNFKVTLREQFDYAQYPLDRQLLWVRMWHVDFEKNVFLVPDIDGYASLRATDRPGLDPGAVLENWSIERSYFSYRLVTYNANFGIDGYDQSQPQPELYFNVAIQRNVLSPLFSRGIAPFVILLQLFVIVMVIGRDSKRLEQFGVRPGAVLFTCAAFVFGVLVAQNSLRDEVKWYSFVYLEYLHVITYFVIIAVAINSVLLVAKPELHLFKQGNAWVRMLYWPVVTLLLLATTLLLVT